jgi:hypothetical protein
MRIRVCLERGARFDLAAVSCVFSVFAMLVSGCVFEGEEVHETCNKICGELADCGEIDASDRRDCARACRDELAWSDDDELDELEDCVEDWSCKRIDKCGFPSIVGWQPEDPAEDVCDPDQDPGDAAVPAHDAARPVPDSSVEPEPDAATPMADASMPDASGPVPDASEPEPGCCTVDDDCAAHEGCRDGLCRAHCEASCECRRGDVCEEGLCVPPPPVQMTCQTNCDCPAGDVCSEHACVTPD